MRKIIFISHDPLTDTIKRNNYLERFIADGVSIEYWCVRNIVKYANNIPLNNEISEPYYTEITTIDQLAGMLKERAASAWICTELWFNWDTAAIYTLLKPYAARLFEINWYCNVPGISLKKKIKHDLVTLKFRKIYDLAARFLDRKLFNMYAKMKHLAPPALLFVPGSEYAAPGRRVVPLNHHDFDVFRSNDTKTNGTDRGKYAVFMDVMLPYHPDFRRVGAVALDVNAYYGKLNRFFDRIESEYGLRVIIAAHPKSSYEQEFNDREVIKGRSSELVAGSSLVLTHHSISLYYAILGRKPLVLMTMDVFKYADSKNYALQTIHYLIELFAGMLHCTMVNLDETAPLKIHDVDEASYERFEKKYIKGGSNKSNYAVITETLGLSK